MMTREEIAAIDRECEEQHISQQDYLESHGIAKHQYYRWKRRYRDEDEQSLVPAGFVDTVSSSVSGTGPSVKHYFRIIFPRKTYNRLIAKNLRNNGETCR